MKFLFKKLLISIQFQYLKSSSIKKIKNKYKVI